jgi:hypothetical protein
MVATYFVHFPLWAEEKIENIDKNYWYFVEIQTQNLLNRTQST